jgi:competence protein ComEC
MQPRGQYGLLLWTILVIGCLTWLHHWTFVLPYVREGLMVCCGLSLVLVLAKRWRLANPRLTRLIFGLFGLISLLFYTQIRVQERLAQTVPQAWLHEAFLVEGEIVELPVRTPFGVRFSFWLSEQQSDVRLQSAAQTGSLPRLVSVSWYDDDLPSQTLRLGQVWRLPMSMRVPHASLNSGGFDQEKSWWAQGVRAIATVRVNQNTEFAQLPKLVKQEEGVWYALQHWRADALARIDETLPRDEIDSVAVFKALTLGEQNDISASSWRLFQQTGVTHLVSISGVHITMLAALVMWLVQRLWRRSVWLCEWMPSVYAGQWLGVFVALLYSLVAGWGLPAQRTVLMLVLWLVLSRLGVAVSAVRVLCLALLVAVVFDPFCVLTLSFWLSFGAVAWLVLAFSTWSEDFEGIVNVSWRMRWHRLVGGQVATGMALLPMSVYFFQQAPLFGVLINLVAIPLVSAVVTPLLLLSVLSLMVFGWASPLLWANGFLRWCLNALTWLNDRLPEAMWKADLNWWQALLLVGFGVLLVNVWRRGWRVVAAAAMAVIVFGLSMMPKERVPYGQVFVHVLDVGQGSAVVLRMNDEVWVYDAGPRYGSDSDAGLRVLLPFLRDARIDVIDKLILSHDDADHTGGAASLTKAMRVREVVSSIGRDRLQTLGVLADGYVFCQVKQNWHVSGVDLIMLNPEESLRESALASDNQKSCVLRVEAVAQGQWRSFVLAGDIDALQEARLVVLPIGGVRRWLTDVALMSHHGSIHSSSAPWLEAIQPKIAIAQAGFMSQFGHPHPWVVARYHDMGAQVVNTAQGGEIRFCLGCPSAGLRQYRQTQPYLWRDMSDAQQALRKNN